MTRTRTRISITSMRARRLQTVLHDLQDGEVHVCTGVDEQGDDGDGVVLAGDANGWRAILCPRKPTVHCMTQTRCDAYPAIRAIAGHAREHPKVTSQRRVYLCKPVHGHALCNAVPHTVDVAIKHTVPERQLHGRQQRAAAVGARHSS